MPEPASGHGGQPEATAAAGTTYFEELHTTLVIALVVVCIALGLVGWQLHPNSNGFQAVPQDLRVLVAGSGFNAVETIHQTGADSATLIVSAKFRNGFVPLRDTDSYSVFGGPQAAGAASAGIGSPVHFDKEVLPAHDWTYIVLNPGTAQPCDTSLHYRSGTVKLPVGHATPALVVPPLKPIGSVGGTVSPPGLCLRFASSAPFSLSGPYLSARFPPLRGVSTDVVWTDETQVGDLGAATVNRVLYLDTDTNTADFSIQTDPHPSVTTASSWSWTIAHTPQVIQVAATNASDAQHENNNAFYSGILFGVVGGALIALITELIVPLRRQHRRHPGH